MRLRAVLFDLDGTLLNRRETFRCHLELQVARLPELFAPAGDVDMLAVWKRDRYWAEPQDADWVIDDLGELLPLVLGRGVSRNLSA